MTGQHQRSSVEKHRNKLLVTVPAPQISKLFSAWSLGALHFRRRRKVKYELHTDNEREHTENGMLSFVVEVATPDSNHPRKSAKKPCAIRVYPMLVRGLILSKNVISMLKIVRKCTIFVKVKSANNENQVALLSK